MEYQLLKQLYSTTSKLVNAQVDRVNENFDKADKIIIWIVGFSIGVFVLILTRKSNSALINALEYEISIISLLVVILGLLFRIVSFFTQMRLNNIVIEFLAYSTGFTNTEKIPTPRTILITDTLDEIIYYFESDFGIKMNKIDTSSFSKEKLNEYRDLYKNYYESLAETNDPLKQMTEFSSELSQRFGLKEETIENTIDDKNSNKRKGKAFQRMLKFSYVLFFLTISSFIFGIGFLAYKIIEQNCT